jgi:hypothetical protein
MTCSSVAKSLKTSQCARNTMLLISVVIILYIGYYLFYGQPADKFINVSLNEVKMPAVPYPSGLGQSVNKYNCYFNPATNTDLETGSLLAVNNIRDNYPKIQSRLIQLNGQVSNKLEELNYNLLTQIQKNYYDAHYLNMEREHNKLKLDDLPIRNI